MHEKSAAAIYNYLQLFYGQVIFEWKLFKSKQFLTLHSAGSVVDCCVFGYGLWVFLPRNKTKVVKLLNSWLRIWQSYIEKAKC